MRKGIISMSINIMLMAAPYRPNNRRRKRKVIQARHAGLFPKKEVRSLVPDNDSRPGDVFLPTWRGRPYAFDVAVTSPLCASNVQQAASNTGAALEKMKATKNAKHFVSCRRNNISFMPLVVKTLGGWDSEASFHLQKIAEMTSQRSSERAAGVTRHFFQRLSVILQRANASLMATRAPPLPPPQILGH